MKLHRVISCVYKHVFILATFIHRFITVNIIVYVREWIDKSDPGNVTHQDRVRVVISISRRYFTFANSPSREVSS